MSYHVVPHQTITTTMSRDYALETLQALRDRYVVLSDEYEEAEKSGKLKKMDPKEEVEFSRPMNAVRIMMGMLERAMNENIEIRG